MEISKPNYTALWAETGGKAMPSQSKISEGWTAEIPLFEHENWRSNRVDSAIAYLFQRGVAEWDSVTEYWANKSLVFGSNGQLYKAQTNNTNANPLTDTTAWKILFDGSLATSTTPGIVQLATNAEIATGTNNTKVITPSGLVSRQGNTTRTGLLQLATSLEVTAGIDDTKAITSAGVKVELDKKSSISATNALFPFRGIQVYSTPGVFTWNVPDGVTRVHVTVTGGGGGGSRGGDNSTCGACGGAGGTAVDLVDLSGVGVVSLTVGTGGAGAAISGANAQNGSTSSFGTYLTGGGGGRAEVFAGGSGGSAIGALAVNGGDGSDSSQSTNAGAGGGMGGNSYWGGGGRAGKPDGLIGKAHGTGGGGAFFAGTGGAGRGGIVVIKW